MLKVAILGANGFIGSRTAERLHLAGLAEVRPIVRSFASLARLSRFSLDFRVADAFDQPALRDAFTGCDVVVHAVAGDRRVILGTLAPVYRAAQEAGVSRLIYLSTASVHGQTPLPGTDESCPLSDRQPLDYNNAKVQAEWKLLKLRGKGNVELVMLRPGIVHGPGSYWVTSFAQDLLQGQAYLLDEGQGICNAVFIDNLIHAMYLAMTASGVDRQAFLVGDEELVRWSDLYRPIAEALGFKLEQITEGLLPEPDTSWQARFEAIRISDPVQSLLSVLPLKLRHSLYLAVNDLWESPSSTRSPWSLPAAQKPMMTQEMMMLYRCQYKLPFDKAAMVLGYKPIISFDDACRRSVAWLAFAGYPVRGQAR
jgi:nucleoside-diphosphate-sugar epimerase